MVENDATLFFVRRMTQDALFVRLRKYSPPPSAVKEVPDLRNGASALLAVNLWSMNIAFLATSLATTYLGCHRIGSDAREKLFKNSRL
ncbi:MAG: hypothetical protein U5K76_03340 [Woeseiaceae bacterium]|nr:hypothetical protein [Woeseiaceae bacterium]